MPRRIETLFLSGPAGRLEALLEEPEHSDPVEAALVCHPHPQFGGTMHNKVVYRVARGLRKAGCVVMRFNYRGVNLSEGEYADSIGETEDARHALHELRQRYPQLPLFTAGFSFGSRIALRLALDEKGVERTLAVGFPTSYPDNHYVAGVRVAKYFVQSTHDDIGPEKEMTKFYDALPPPKQLFWVAAADHFFRDNLDGFEDVVREVAMKR